MSLRMLMLALTLMTVFLPGGGLVAGWAAAASGTGEREQAAALAFDPALQEGIGQAVESLITAHDEEARLRAVADARSLTGGSLAERVRLLEQVELFLAGANGTEAAMGGAVLLHALEFDREEVMAATLPHLVDADPALHKVLAEVAEMVVDPDMPEDPIPLVLEAERLRLEADRSGAGASRSDQVPPLLERLARDPSHWVRGYASSAMEAWLALGGSAVAPD